ncbi:hypothetical protein [Serratia proteamaculans]|uniref:hypothetical protein n=1 Tax=Serratia proteamaculans TaxID=28151 RepID=UPI002980E91B|nr:hypothetical protein [Serratia proteamaculans]MDW5511764.1 hypothetical protein [Serratia proteamaculans]
MKKASTEDLRIFLMEVTDEIGSAHPETRDTKISARLLRDVLTELLANREAQPVGYIAEVSGNRVGVLRGLPMPDVGSLIYTAPPAPAYPETLPCAVRLIPGLLFGKGVKTRLMLEALGRREEFEAERDAMTPEQKAEQDSAIKALFSRMAPPAPAVTGEILAAMDEVIRISDRDHDAWSRAKSAIAACRAAMLAQPQNEPQNIPNNIPDTCQWTYDEHDSKWDSGCGDAWMFCDGGPVENGVKFCQGCGKSVSLAAAPEGGNEK